MKTSITNIVFGFILIAFGIIMIGNQFDYWSINVFFDGWWSLFLIIPCLVSLFERGIDIGNIIGLFIGLMLLLSAQDIITWNQFVSIIVPVLLIIVGFQLIFKKAINQTFHQTKRSKGGRDKAGMKYYTAVFSGVEESIKKEEFQGAFITSVFGGVELDLRDAKITEDVTINVTSVFGGSDIIIPSDVNIEITSTNIFGGYDSPKREKDPKKSTIFLNIVNIFGGTDIK